MQHEWLETRHGPEHVTEQRRSALGMIGLL